MGNETFYCVQCGIRVIGLDGRGDRSHCPACLPPEPAPPPSSKRLRRPSSGALVAVAAPLRRAPPVVRPRRSRAALAGAFAVAGAVVLALAPRLSPKAGPTSSVLVAPPAKPAPPPAPVAPAPPPVDPAIEALAVEIEEAASTLADEGRFEDALARIRLFPDDGRRGRAWARLDGLKRQIEARARSK